MRTIVRFTCDKEIAAIGLGLVKCTLPKPEWTHAAHFASALWLMHSGVDCIGEMPGLIRAYNQATGVANTDSSGYHETITRASLRAAHAFLTTHSRRPLFAICNALLSSSLGESNWLLTYWSRRRLFSVEARRAWVDPDLAPLPYPEI